MKETISFPEMSLKRLDYINSLHGIFEFSVFLGKMVCPTFTELYLLKLAALELNFIEGENSAMV